MQCEMCGKKEEELYKTIVEGVKLAVCQKCASFGKIISRIITEEEKPKTNTQRQPIIREEKELVETIVENYAEKIKKKREDIGLKQEELAQKIAEKESIIHKIENGKIVPQIKLARKLEKFLGIRLVETEEAEENPTGAKGTSEGFTIGDMIKIKKK